MQMPRPRCSAGGGGAGGGRRRQHPCAGRGAARHRARAGRGGRARPARPAAVRGARGRAPGAAGARAGARAAARPQPAGRPAGARRAGALPAAAPACSSLRMPARPPLQQAGGARCVGVGSAPPAYGPDPCPQRLQDAVGTHRVAAASIAAQLVGNNGAKLDRALAALGVVPAAMALALARPACNALHCACLRLLRRAACTCLPWTSRRPSRRPFTCLPGPVSAANAARGYWQLWRRTRWRPGLRGVARRGAPCTLVSDVSHGQAPQGIELQRPGRAAGRPPSRPCRSPGRLLWRRVFARQTRATLTLVLTLNLRLPGRAAGRACTAPAPRCGCRWWSPPAAYPSRPRQRPAPPPAPRRPARARRRRVRARRARAGALRPRRRGRSARRGARRCRCRPPLAATWYLPHPTGAALPPGPPCHADPTGAATRSALPKG